MTKGIMDKDEYFEILNEIGKDDHKNNEYCIYREILKTLLINKRVLVQFKCIEKLKYILSEKENRFIDWEEAAICWVELGYAKKFSEIYNENNSIKEIFDKVYEK